jgi:hypothetical protein
MRFEIILITSLDLFEKEQRAARRNNKENGEVDVYLFMKCVCLGFFWPGIPHKGGGMTVSSKRSSHFLFYSFHLCQYSLKLPALSGYLYFYTLLYHIDIIGE